jgi:hypothetical protein
VPDLPSGTVTLLFTDIEGSTRLLHQLGDRYGDALADHRRLQVLLSEATRQLLHGHEPAGLGLRDLGQHRLRDLTRPQRLYQVVGDALAAEFPPLKTLENRPTNLPTQPTPLLGRSRELTEVAGQLARETTRLVTLTGPDGTGKTRLALQAAADALDGYPGGVFLVALAATSDPALVVPTVAQTPGSGRAPAARSSRRCGTSRRTGGSCSCSTTSSRSSRPRRRWPGCSPPARACACWSPAGSRCACPGSRSTRCRPCPSPTSRAWGGPTPPGCRSTRRWRCSWSVPRWSSRASRSPTTTPRPWPRSASGWTVCPWPSSWARPWPRCRRPRRCWTGWGSGCAS